MHRALLLAASFITLFSGSVYADVIPQDVYVCNNLSAGSPCDNDSGVCQDSTCSRLDYSKWDRDASSTPPSTSYSCRRCIPKGTTTSTATSTATTGDGKEDDSKDSSGCSVGGARMVAPWLLAGIFAACVTLLRRRPR